MGLTLPDWVQQMLERLDSNFTGRVEFNVFKGGIANVNVMESHKPTK